MTKHTTPNFFSISLANAKVNPLWFGLAYLVSFVLYWESFSGVPVWDDTTYWFFDINLIEKQTYASIWSFSTWPLTISLQKLLYAVGGTKWWFYHGFNFVIHGINSWLVYYFLRTIGLKQIVAFAGLLLFLLHPANVIAVAWMIQVKTLICFAFGIGSLVVFMRRTNFDHTVISYVLFLLSVLSKSASLPLPVALLFLAERPFFRKKNLAIIPFFVIMVFGALRINYSNVALEGVKDALETTGKGIRKSAPKVTAPPVQEEEARETDTFAPQPDEPLVKAQEDFTPEDVTYHPNEKGAVKVEPTKTLTELSPVAAKRRLFIKTLHYYFWQAYVPVNNVPVKGQNPFPPTLWDYFHLVFLSLLILISAKFYLFYLLAAGHIFLLPYLGLIPAPYMNITWVSDQHLYIALPFFIALFLCLFERVKFLWKGVLVAVLVLFFCVKTKEAVEFYKDNTTFYRASIYSNFNNVPLVYNLAVLYVAEGKTHEAKDLLQLVIDLSRNEPYLIENKYFPYLVHLKDQIDSGGIRN